ncbi:hypothetical protein BV25DRAFT_1835184 [Artomyces pyxidatus]|uniref:Uncharacterized protein n=1 Tax=Artomyces pyxidatus TaxID=48021 RepID=A0ACB8TGI3_9AGAM|nr:hypothetical protein BV25DRAFT_1835184 [Artomyces pyxidatus]
MPLTPALPNLLFSLGGFSATTTTSKLRKILLKQWSTPQAGERLVELITPTPVTAPDDPPPAPPPTETQLFDLLQAIEVECVAVKLTGAVAGHRFNIIAPNMTLTNPDHWYCLVDALQSMRYSDSLQGTGALLPPVRCSLCKADDHPRGLCPFPVTPGWLGGSRRYPGSNPGPPTSSRYQGNPNQHWSRGNQYDDRRDDYRSDRRGGGGGPPRGPWHEDRNAQHPNDRPYRA